MEAIDIIRRQEGELEEREHEALKTLLREAFPEQSAFHFRSYIFFPPKERWIILTGDQIVGQLAIHHRRLKLDSDRWQGRAIADFCVLASQQGKGLGRKLLEACADYERGEGADCLLLSGEPDLYQKLGFSCVFNLIYRDEGGATTLPKAHIKLLQETHRWPAGDVEMIGGLF